MKRRRQIISVLLVVVVLLTGCNTSDEEYISPSKRAQIQSEIILRCILERDEETLKALFCQEIKDTHDLDKEIEVFLNFIDGNIVSYDEPRGYTSGTSASEEEGVYRRILRGHIRNIKTDIGKTYYIGHVTCDVYKENEKYEGTTLICIEDVDSYVDGEGYEHEAIIGEVLD